MIFAGNPQILTWPNGWRSKRLANFGVNLGEIVNGTAIGIVLW